MSQRQRLRMIIDGSSPKQSARKRYDEQEREEMPQIKKIITDKYRTFTKWNFKESVRVTKKKQLSSKKSGDSILSSKQYKLNLSSLNPKNKQDNNNGGVVGELAGVKSERRERFKRLKFPMQFIKHYMEKENFRPSQQQTQLIQKLLAIQKWIDNIDNIEIDKVLQKLYKLMNITVDYNELQFLSLLILLTGDICFFYRDMKRSFFFYNQARLAGSYSQLDRLKTQALLGMGMVTFELQQYQISMKIFKKALQYAWKIDHEEIELQIYDLFGKCLFYDGKIKQSVYYHTRYAQNQIESKHSALKKISKEMLQEYQHYIQSLQNQNLNSLFIEYLDLPITNPQYCELNSKKEKVFKNYEDGSSPRVKRKHKDFSSSTFLPVKFQIDKFINDDQQFISEIPFPDNHQNFASNQKYGKRNSLDFEHSITFNKIIGFKHPKPDLEKVLKLPLQKQIQLKLKDKMDPLWWEEMVSETKKRRKEKVGNLKQRVRNSHLSYYKYPTERKKNSLWSSEKINQSFNRVLLDWIDPIK